MKRVSKFRATAIVVGIVGALAAPAAANASNELAISAVPSATVVKAGDSVTFKVTVTNHGTEAYEGVFVNLSSLRGHGQGANNPYLSVSSSQGACRDTSGSAFGYYYYNFVCELGPLASGASAQITAVVTVNESMNHFASLLPNAYEGGFQDDNNVNNEAVDRISASAPPVLTGSKKLKLTGLPAGCASKDFTLRASTAVKGVKKMAAVMFLGFSPEGEGQEWKKLSRGSHLVATVPVSRLVPELGASYKLKVKAKRGAAKPLKVTVTFQLC
jgi:plastocyanin